MAVTPIPNALLSLSFTPLDLTCTVVPEVASRIARQEARDLMEMEGYRRMDLGIPSGDFIAALSAFRRQMENFSTEFQKAFLGLDLPTRFHLVELFFGPFPHRVLSRPDTALPLVRLLGETGFHRELAVSTFSDGEETHAVVSIGTTDSVTTEEKEDVLVLHTHPLTDVEIEEPFLPSDPDISDYMGRAVGHFRRWEAAAEAVLSVYDPDGQVFKNWIQSPYGASRTEVEIAAENIFNGARIFYAVRPGFENDEWVRESLNPKRLEMRAYAKGRNYRTEFQFLPAESYHSLIESMPRSLTARRDSPEAK